MNKGHNLRGEIFLPEEVMLHLPLVQRVLYFRLHEHWVQITQGNEGMQINSSPYDYIKGKASCFVLICWKYRVMSYQKTSIIRWDMKRTLRGDRIIH